MAKNKRQVVAMRGINYSNLLTDGDIADSKNISARAYPYITTRKSRTEVGDYSEVTALTVFQDKFVVVEGTNLICDGVTVGQVTRGEKQFAVINTKLVIMPDKVYLDGETMTLCPMGADVLCSTATFTTNSITIGDTSVLVGEGKGVFLGNTFTSASETVWKRKVDLDGSSLRLYDDFEFSVEASKTIRISSNGIDYQKFVGQHIYVKTSTTGQSGRVYQYLGKILSYVFTGSLRLTLDRDIPKEYFDGVQDARIFFPDMVSVGDELTFTLNSNTYTRAKVTSVGSENIILDIDTNDRIVVEKSEIKRELMPNLTSIVKAGDTIFFSAGKFKGTVASVEHNKITMGTSFTISEEHYTEIYLQRDSIDTIKVGDAIEISGGDKNNMTFIVNKIEDKTIFAENEIFEAAEMEKIFLKRNIPDLDFICSSNNRIWGCSSKDRSIYASALGDPTNFFDYSGESTDSYAVPVGSPEDFTGCIGYDNGVFFFKENKIHKVLGSYPAEYVVYDYDLEGVQRGCHKSMQIINEVLYYKGRHGIYAFSGAPSLISSNFGERDFYDAVAGNDGDTYYISMRDGEKYYLFAYELRYGMWVLEGNERAIDFVRKNGDMYMLLEGGKFCLCGAGDSEAGIDWHVQFTPLYETIEGQKSYSRIVFRLELPRGSHIAIDVKTDGGAWREAGKVVGRVEGIVPVPVPINRCDRFEIRIRGKGKCTIHQMVREFFVGGDK